MWKAVIFVSIVSLLHSTFSATQYRSYLRLVEQPFAGVLPLDILLQALLSLLLALVAIVNVCANFKEIRALDDLKYKSVETISNRASFYCFNHRGRLL
ncbi:membrane magnesium transporter 1-like protein [Dinothrombium tinctorium]|uniref:Membrane magnesium transporter n=1 Tax=Dinothrombium tinctorium TaxID=1965070 RepID=A0A3S3PPI9_9ACAR|nr:membrane magnesium transporter 1-like protein [Dinothrombium tinctorium]RWS13751.1 membrane magnesium transporter 1-like protein [Dinothrombium tinctorium]RWS13892.1 membrane magnesium transporter 1-like protein [Dinothrombium tinctorium]